MSPCTSLCNVDYLTGDGAAEGDGSLWKEGEYEAESGSMAESFREDVKDPPEWLLSSEPAREDLSKSLTLLKCPVMRHAKSATDRMLPTKLCTRLSEVSPL